MLYTLDQQTTLEEEIKKSRFIAMADHVDTPEQALEFIAQHSVATATHNCWAYRVGDIYRFYDDGEPGGTAGRPILQAIEGQKCDQVVVLVIRWFGGVKLGTGGLARAYAGVAAQCLRQAPRSLIVPKTSLVCHCPFGDMALVQSRLALMDASVLEETFDEKGVRWILQLPVEHTDVFIAQFTDMTRGQGTVDRIE